MLSGAGAGAGSGAGTGSGAGAGGGGGGTGAGAGAGAGVGAGAGASSFFGPQAARVNAHAATARVVYNVDFIFIPHNLELPDTLSSFLLVGFNRTGLILP